MKNITISILPYNAQKGLEFKWEAGFEIETKVVNGEIQIEGNAAGLISLANHLLNLAQEEVPGGYHIHLDDLNALEDGSVALVIVKK
ncbi:Imm32 family immunity protein [Chitinophaga rhizosphaerae]|uniref:Imm32 family immunity protein n=1 Tax=Chitinophaga rhizosphaerae TaxID=1864947 RepID=UPI000F8148F7|nr:hypothetical protein [Chitinophaga rhizosphaerae]